jgi:PAB-dependent poly(A)-specific ribonuclease subunit 2
LQDDLELRSDGTRKVIRPSRLSLARVSCLRGTGEKEEQPFLDDHIHTSEPVIDYLTDFSGIHAGDLDPHVSEHTLVPLKVAYKKLRLLVDQGCTFIGHGLSKDFRIINIYVPPSQVYDTVDIYSSPLNRRKISLKFLSWFLLKSDIQSGEHDSIEVRLILPLPFAPLQR